ncbi:MAG: hypothetical protein AMXMBFR12_02660 [Candidatus Babeliales bacterium]
MNKRFLVFMLIWSMCANAMEPNTAIKLYVDNAVKGSDYLLEFFKYWVIRTSAQSDCCIKAKQYFSEQFRMEQNTRVAGKIWPDSCGVIELRDPLAGPLARSELTMIYYWNAKQQKLSFHLYKKYCDSIALHMAPESAANGIRFVLNGTNFKDSYFTYPVNPEKK